jgi:hypothetical protein
MNAIKAPMIPTSGAAMCNHSVRVTHSPPIMVGPIPQTASKIDKNIPADARAANHVRTRMATGGFKFVTGSN